MSRYYVYVVKVGGVVRYVGKGTKDRYKHAVSGTSSVAQLNKDFFDGKEITVHRAFFRDSSEEAEDVEKMYISALLYDGAELYNKTVPKTQYPGDGYLDMFENIPCAKSYNGKLVDIQEELRQETKSEVLREIWEAKENGCG